MINVVVFLLRDVLDDGVDLVLNGLEERLSFLEEFAIFAEIATLGFEGLFLFGQDLRLAFLLHLLGEEDLLGLVVGLEHTRFFVERIHLALPAFADHRELLVGGLVLRQVLEDILHIHEGNFLRLCLRHERERA